ncbi:putative plant peroxidase, hem peroxidase, hem peroxidase superfamily, peroxidase, active [Helianthus debilis subsp. tardiflorus]
MASSSSFHMYSLLTYIMCLCVLIETTSGQLSANFYGSSCPNFSSIISSAVNSAVSNEARMGASLLRLHFHDCFVNASLQSLSLLCFLWVNVLYFIKHLNELMF